LLLDLTPWKLPVHVGNDTAVHREQRRPPTHRQSTAQMVDDCRTTARHVGGVVKNRITEENDVLAHGPCPVITSRLDRESANTSDANKARAVQTRRAQMSNTRDVRPQYQQTNLCRCDFRTTCGRIHRSNRPDDKCSSSRKHQHSSGRILATPGKTARLQPCARLQALFDDGRVPYLPSPRRGRGAGRPRVRLE
jgi:hypothetical protein